MISFIAGLDPLPFSELPPTDLRIDQTNLIPELREALQLNDGLRAELAVRGELIQLGWSVEYVGNRRGLGYDLLASRGDEMMRVEVKSSTGFVTPELTENEWKAAESHGDSFVLATVDFVGTEDQAIHFVRDPAASFMPTEIQTVTYRIRRSELDELNTDGDFL